MQINLILNSKLNDTMSRFIVQEFNYIHFATTRAANELMNKICDSGAKVPKRKLHTGCRCIRTEMASKILISIDHIAPATGRRTATKRRKSVGQG